MKEMGKILAEVFWKEKKKQMERKGELQRVIETGLSYKLSSCLL